LPKTDKCAMQPSRTRTENHLLFLIRAY